MQLTDFRVRNYRSVNDSGNIPVSDRTALIGRNESGKTNLLSALEGLHPVGGLQALSFIKDFPRDRESTDYSDDLPVVDTLWALEAEEAEALAGLYPRASSTSRVRVSRSYRDILYVAFDGLPAPELDRDMVNRQLTALRRALHGTRAYRNDADAKVRLDACLEDLAQLGGDVRVEEDQQRLADNQAEVVGVLGHLTESSDAAFNTLADLLDEWAGNQTQHLQAIEWVAESLPNFVYLSDIPELNGQHDLAAYAQRRRKGELTEADIGFERLAKVAGFDPEELMADGPGGREHRQQIIHRAGGTITRKLRQAWSDRPIKVRFNLDGDYFDTLISDPTSIYDMEVNLNDRSRGFQWFFSLFVLLSADSDRFVGGKALLLLDEPGLHLHALGQQDLLDHLSDGFDGQIIYVTHSPFMIPVEDISSIRTVTYDHENGTRCSEKPRGDAATLYPIQVAMAYASDEGLFGENPMVLVPTLGDYLYLSAMQTLFEMAGQNVVDDGVEILPLGGMDRAAYLLASFGDDHDGLVLLVNDRDPRWPRFSALLGEASPVIALSSFVSDEGGACVEGLLPRDYYDSLVRQVYKKELGRKRWQKAASGHSVVDHYSQFLDSAGLVFDRTRIASRFMKDAIGDPDVINPETRKRFKRLFKALNDALR